jgi:hypothetical protein
MTSTPQHALALTTWAAPRGGYRSPFAALARVEAARLARHPMLVAGTVLGILFTAIALDEQSDRVTGDSLGLPVVALTVGVGSMLAAFHLTRSLHRADELVEASPTSQTARTAALCVTTLVPMALASAWLVLYYAFTPPALDAPDWMYGVFSRTDVATVLVGNSVVAAAGGTLLGIAAGRWWRFRGASALLVLVVVTWTMGVLASFSSAPPAPSFRWVRLLAPVGSFTSGNAEDLWVFSLTGSPWWYLAWLVTLCVLAAVAALLWRSEDGVRTRLVRVGTGTLAAAVVTYALAAGGGLSQPVQHFPDGHSVVVTR